MAAKKDENVYLETMEEAENEDTELTKAWYSEGYGVPMGKYKKGILENFRKPNLTLLDNK